MRGTPIVITLVLLLSFGSAATTQYEEAGLKQQIKKFKNSRRFLVKYDKFKDRTVVRVGPFGLTGSMEYALTNTMIGILAGFGYEGAAIQKSVEAFSLGFTYSGKEWEFLKDRDVYALVDGERMQLGKADRASDINLGSVEELLSVSMDTATFNKIANAKVVEIKVGNREFKLKNEHLQAFRDLESLTKTIALPSSNSHKDKVDENRIKP